MIRLGLHKNNKHETEKVFLNTLPMVYNMMNCSEPLMQLKGTVISMMNMSYKCTSKFS